MNFLATWLPLGGTVTARKFKNQDLTPFFDGVAYAKISPCIVADGGAESNRYHDGFKHIVRAQIKESSTLGEISSRSFRELWYSADNRWRLAAINPTRNCQHHCVTDAKNRLLADYLSLAPDHLAFI